MTLMNYKKYMKYNSYILEDDIKKNTKGFKLEKNKYSFSKLLE